MSKMFLTGALLIICSVIANGQQTASPATEKKAALNETAIALDSSGSSALEATLRTTEFTGTEESPISTVRILVRNSSSIPFSFISGVVTFYDSSGVRCAEGVFKSEALAIGETVETDLPGIRIRCAATGWRVVATSLLPRTVPSTTFPPVAEVSKARRLVISIDGERHPIQLDKPVKLTLGERERTIVVQEEP